MPTSVDIVEQAYSLDGDEAAWLNRLAEANARCFDDGLGALAWSFRWQDGEFGMSHIAATGAAAELTEMPIKLAAMGSEQLVSRTLRAFGLAAGTTSERAPQEEFEQIMRQCAPEFVADFLAIQALDFAGCGVLLGLPLQAQRRLSEAERASRERLAVHLNAGFRLRRVVSAIPSSSVAHADCTEAVIQGDQVVHATGNAREPDARQRLRQAALNIDRARTSAGRNDEQAALEAWQGLVDGRWSLVDQFDADGRRYQLAIKNPVHCPDPRALTLRERQVATLVAGGMTNTLVAYTCGIKESTVSGHLARAVKKLGFKTSADLVQWLNAMRQA